MMDDTHSPDVAALARQLTATAAADRVAAAELLARAGDATAEAVVPLVTACGDDDEQVREWAAAALEELGPPPRESLAALTGLVASTHPLVAYWATTLLGRLGQDAASATTVLVTALEAAPDPAVRERAAWALGRIGPAAAAARAPLERIAADAASHGDQRLARLATEALAAIGTPR